MTANCMTCRHRSHDAEGMLVCEKVYGGVACGKCHRVQTVLDFAHDFGSGILCRSCNQGQPYIGRDDWREGYLGNPINGQLTPIPCCPGWQADEVKIVKVIPAARSLFGDDDDK